MLMLIDFEHAKKQIETRRSAAAEKELQQQSWFLDTEVRLKEKSDYIILLLIIDCLIGLVAIMM